MSKGKLLVIGSGPIVIGQAAEFDFSGSQACRSLREEGYTTVLVNSNPATIQTDLEMADIVYIEPLNVETIAEIILKEKIEKPVDPGLFQHGSEGALWEASCRTRSAVEGQIERREFAAAVATLITLKEPVDRFFDDVLVMTDEVDVRTNRLALLRDLQELFARIADISRIQIESN